MQAKNFTINIPTKPYLAKYISSRYGHPVLLNNNTLFGIVILSLLQKKVHNHIPLRLKHLQFRTFTAEITCLAKWSYMNDYGVDLTDDQIIQLNRAWDAQFDEELFFHVKRSIRTEGRYKGYNEAIESFAEINGIIIGEDTTFECLKKTEYRFRKQQQNILVKSVPSQISGDENIFVKNVPSLDPPIMPTLF